MQSQLKLPGFDLSFDVVTKKEAPVQEAPSVEQTLAERGARYGSFKDQSEIADAINTVFVESPNWNSLAPDSREALRIIANKIGRILNGDHEYDDNWRDIAGYATLVLNRINSSETV